MQHKSSYHTRQRKILMDFLKQHQDRQCSSNEICSALCAPHTIGRSTVYRLLSQFVNDGLIRRFAGADGKSVLYQYAGTDGQCNGHLHLKCVGCGLLIHLDCAHASHFSAHIDASHHFRIDTARSVLYGLCASCGTKEQQL